MTSFGDADAEALRRLIMGFRATQMLHAAARLGLADRLAGGPRAAEALAGEAGADPRVLHRLLRALVSLGVFARLPDGRYASNPMGRLLESDRPGSLHGVALFYGGDVAWAAYGRLTESVTTGETAFLRAHGLPFYDYLERHAEARALFQSAMTGFSDQEATAILAAYDFAGFGRVLDVGGGEGALLAALLRAHPSLSGTLFDLPAVAIRAADRLAEAGLAGQVQAVGGDAFVAVPAGHDLLLLKSVLHNWEDAAAIGLLTRCRQAMAMEARLLVIERVVPEDETPSEAKLFDINMLVTTGGRERSAGEYAALLEAAGLRLRRLIPTRLPLSLIEAVPTEAASRG